LGKLNKNIEIKLLSTSQKISSRDKRGKRTRHFLISLIFSLLQMGEDLVDKVIWETVQNLLRQFEEDDKHEKIDEADCCLSPTSQQRIATPEPTEPDIKYTN
jgi:hypothetical protein